MSLPRLVTACLCSWGLHSGYVQLSIRDVVSGGVDIITVEHYFGNCADIGEHTVYVSINDAPTDQVELMVFFDRNLHRNGTQRCSYLVVKKAAGLRAVDLTWSDYVAMVIVIDECVHFFCTFFLSYHQIFRILRVVPASETVEAFAKHKATYQF
jgi:hypothetical protein